jgi:hypothetical protein
VATTKVPKTYKLLIVSKECNTEQVYDGSYVGKTVVRNMAVCSTVVDFPSVKEAEEAIKAVQEQEKHMGWMHHTTFRKLWKDVK